MQASNQILFLRKMKDDFVFTSGYTDLLAKRLILDGHSLDVYDFRKRKLMNINDKVLITYFKNFNLLDKTPFRLLTNFIALLSSISVAICVQLVSYISSLSNTIILYSWSAAAEPFDADRSWSARQPEGSCHPRQG